MCTLFAAVSTAPLDLLVTDVTSSGFNLEWDPPSSPNGIIDFYQVELFTENSLDLPALNAVNVSSTSYNFTGLAPFTGYSVQVCAYTVGCGDVATLNVTTLGGKRGQASLYKKEPFDLSLLYIILYCHHIYTYHYIIYNVTVTIYLTSKAGSVPTNKILYCT